MEVRLIVLRRLPFFYGWIVVAVAFVTMDIGVNTRTAFSLLFPPILAEFGWDRAATAGAFSIGFVVATVYVPFMGLAMDRLGPRIVIPFGVVICSAGLVPECVPTALSAAELIVSVPSSTSSPLPKVASAER